MDFNLLVSGNCWDLPDCLDGAAMTLDLDELKRLIHEGKR
jgi:hypothetical protein